MDEEKYELWRSACNRYASRGVIGSKEIIIELEREVRMYRAMAEELTQKLSKQQYVSERTMHMKCECDLSGLEETKKKLSECVRLADQLNNLIDRLK